MKQLRLTLAATVLTLALALSAMAGDMPGGFVQPPAPGQPTLVIAGEASGEIPLDPMTETTFMLLQNVLSLF